jgi:hypothetical protein
MQVFCATRTQSASQREPAKLSASPPEAGKPAAEGRVIRQENEWATKRKKRKSR